MGKDAAGNVYEGRELDRVPPQDVDAERSVLGAMFEPIGNRDTIGAVVEVLGDDIDKCGLYREAHKKIYAAILRLYDAGRPVDLVTMTTELMRSDDLEKVGGVPYLDEMIESVPASENVKYYADMVKEQGLRRKAIRLAAQMSFRSFDNSEEISDVLDDAADALVDIRQWDSGIDGALKSVETAFLEYAEFIDHIEDWSIKFGIPLFDSNIRFSIGDVAVLIAHNGNGKSLFCSNMQAQAWQKQRAKSIYFSLEMMSFSLYERLAAILWGFHPRDIQKVMMNEGDDLISDTLSEDEGREALRKAVDHEFGDGLFFVDRPGLTLRQMERVVKATNGARLVIMDYIQLMKGRGENRYERIATITQGLKEFAKRTQTAVLVVSQVNKGVKGKTQRITLDDVRDSGTITEVPDLAFGLWQDEKDAKIKHVEILKSRHMPNATGRRVKLFFPNESPFLAEMQEDANGASRSFGID